MAEPDGVSSEPSQLAPISRLRALAGRLQKRIRRLTAILAAAVGVAALLAITRLSGFGLAVALVVVVVMLVPLLVLFDLSRCLGSAVQLPGRAGDALADTVAGAQSLVSAVSADQGGKQRLIAMVREAAGLVRAVKDSVGVLQLNRLANPAYLTVVAVALLAVPIVAIAAAVLSIAALVV